MGVFEKVMQEHHPAAPALKLTAREAFSAIVVAAFQADGQVTAEEAVRVNDVFNSAKLFRLPPAEPAQAITERVVELFRTHGADVVIAKAAEALPPELHAATFTVAVDLVLADGEASAEERKFIDGLQVLLGIPDEEAVKIVDVIIVKNSV